MKRSPLVEVRVPADLVGPLMEGVASPTWRESVVFALASDARLPARRLLLLKRIIPLPAAAYLRDAGHGAIWQGAAMLPIMNQAIAENLGIVMFHRHGGRGPVSLSSDDRQSAGQLLPTFQNLLPHRSHASVVLSDDHVAGMVLIPDATDYSQATRLRCLGGIMRDFGDRDASPSSQSEEQIFLNQKLLIGSEGQARLRRGRVAVVGLSGGGSHVVQQLAHVGLGVIAGIDGDHVEDPNRSRMIGASPFDAILHRKKTSVMARLVRRINRRVHFLAVPHAVPRQEAIDALKESDIVVGCVDNFHAKADLQELCWRYLIPYIDIGLLIRPIEGTDRIAIGGNVGTFIPGGLCQWCIDFLTDEKLKAETGGRPRSYFEGADKQAQVVSMNGLLASQAVTDVLQLLTGFASADTGTTVRKFDGLEGTLTKWYLGNRDRCARCKGSLAAGDAVWTPA